MLLIILDPHFAFSGTTFLRSWSKGGNFFFIKVYKHWHGRKGREKESNTVKGADLKS